MKPTIEIVFRPDGQIVIDAVGFKGPDCQRATAFIEQALGRVDRRKTKPEYHVTQTSRAQQKVGG